MKLSWNQLSGMPIVLDSGKNSLGRINACFIDPENGRIIGFLVGLIKVLVPADIQKWTNEYVSVDEKDVLVPASDIFRIQEFGFRRCYFMSKKVLTKSGVNLGRVRDFTIDTMTASLLEFDVCKKFLFYEWERRIFNYQDISQITDSSVILNLDLEQKSKLKVKQTRLIAVGN